MTAVDLPEGLPPLPPLPERIELPILPASLRHMIRLAESERNPLDGQAGECWPNVRGRAQAAVPVLRDACQPAPFGTIAAWMSWIAMGCVKTPDPFMQELRTVMVADLCGDLPAFCWTRETRRAFVMRGPEGKYFPGDSEVALFLRAVAYPVQSQLRALEVLLAADRDAEAAKQAGAGLLEDDAPRGDVLRLVGEVRAGLLMPEWPRQREPSQPLPDAPPPPRASYAQGQHLADIRESARAANQARAGGKPLPRRDQGGRGE